jgi:hypothetical protein
MCNFFSFVTEPEKHGGKRFYFNWDYRKEHLKDDNHDSHSSICEFYKLNEDVCNKYEFNPLTKKFEIDQINSQVDDRIQAEDWANKVNFKRIVEPLIVKPIVNPFDLPKVEKVTDEHICLLKQWASIRASIRASVMDAVWDSVWASVRASVWASVMDSVVASVRASVMDSVVASVRDSVMDSVMASVRDATRDAIRDAVRDAVWDALWASVRASIWDSIGDSIGDALWASVRASIWDSIGDSIGDSIWASIGASIGAYSSSFFNIKYKYDFSPCARLWESGLVPSFDGTTWRLHSGKSATVVFEWVRDGE